MSNTNLIKLEKICGHLFFFFFFYMCVTVHGCTICLNRHRQITNYTIFKIKDEMVVSRVSPQPSSSAVS